MQFRSHSGIDRVTLVLSHRWIVRQAGMYTQTERQKRNHTGRHVSRHLVRQTDTDTQTWKRQADSHRPRQRDRHKQTCMQTNRNKRTHIGLDRGTDRNRLCMQTNRNKRTGKPILVSWCFEPGQPQRVISGLMTNGQRQLVI